MEFEKGSRFYKENEDGDKVAEITYKEITDNVVEADHTFVDPSLRGQGVAEQLVDCLVQEMTAEGKKIHPTCPYIVKLFERKEDKYQDINANL